MLVSDKHTGESSGLVFLQPRANNCPLQGAGGMSQEAQRADIATKRVVYQIPGTDAVTIRRDVPYKVVDGEALTVDVCRCSS